MSSPSGEQGLDKQESKKDSGLTLRILFVNRWVGVQKGGTQTHIKELATPFAQRGHSVGIITTDGDELRRGEPSKSEILWLGKFTNEQI